MGIFENYEQINKLRVQVSKQRLDERESYHEIKRLKQVNESCYVQAICFAGMFWLMLCEMLALRTMLHLPDNEY